MSQLLIYLLSFFTHIVSLRPYLIFEFAFVREKLVRYNHSYLKYALTVPKIIQDIDLEKILA